MAIIILAALAVAQVGEPPAAENRPKTMAPRVLRIVAPEFTPEAIEAGITGRVFVSLIVRADGSIDELTVARGLGYGLDEKAIQCVEQWEFKPGIKDGTAVDVRATVEVTFMRP